MAHPGFDCRRMVPPWAPDHRLRRSPTLLRPTGWRRRSQTSGGGSSISQQVCSLRTHESSIVPTKVSPAMTGQPRGSRSHAIGARSSTQRPSSPISRRRTRVRGRIGPRGPLIGSLDRLTLPLVRDHLARHTATPATCWFAQWAGFGLTAGRWSLDLTFRTLPCGPYWLFGGALSDVVGLSLDFANGGSDEPWHYTFRQMGLVHSPTIWWPQDHAWLVHSSFDYDSTIVGGEPSLIQALVDDPEIEALQVDRDVSLYANGDRINGSYPSGWPQRD